jgi:hypothetical protein
MNINEHPIYKNIYDLCQEIEKLPASEQATKVVIMASDLEKPVAKLLWLFREIKQEALNMTDTKKGLSRIIRMCIDAGIPSQTGVNKFKPNIEIVCHNCGRTNIDPQCGYNLPTLAQKRRLAPEEYRCESCNELLVVKG